MDSMVRTTLTIEREIEDARSTRDACVSSKGLLVNKGSRTSAIPARDRSGLSIRLGRWCATIASSPDI